LKILLRSTSKKNLKAAAEIVKKGGLVVYPTDTLYGLGCDPYNQEAVLKAFRVKGRTGKPFPLLVSSLEKARRLGYFPPAALKAAKKFWPGALTLVLRRKPEAPSCLGGDPSLIGLRVPRHPIALSLIELCGGALVGTSANLTGETPPKTAEEAAAQLGGRVDMILNGGRTPLGVGSTVVDFSAEKPKVLRRGAVDVEELSQVLGKL